MKRLMHDISLQYMLMGTQTCFIINIFYQVELICHYLRNKTKYIACKGIVNVH